MFETQADDDRLDEDLARSLSSAARPTTQHSPRLFAAIAALQTEVVAPPRRRRRTVLVSAVLAPVLAIGGAGAAFAATGIDWSIFWPSPHPWADWATHPDASFTYRLPGGGSCTMRLGRITDPPGSITVRTADGRQLDAPTAAKAYLKSGTVWRDADIPAVIAHDRIADKNYAQGPDGKPVPFGYGTANYNSDVEYSLAVKEGIQEAIYRHLTIEGFPAGVEFQGQDQCTGESK